MVFNFGFLFENKSGRVTRVARFYDGEIVLSKHFFCLWKMFEKIKKLVKLFLLFWSLKTKIWAVLEFIEIFVLKYPSWSSQTNRDEQALKIAEVRNEDIRIVAFP